MKKENKIFLILQNIGKSFMLPIALLPIAGLFLGIGASFSDPKTINSLGVFGVFLAKPIISNILILMSQIGNIIFSNLAIIFAAGVAMGMAENEKAGAVISSIISFLTMHQAISAMLFLNSKLVEGAMPSGAINLVCGIRSLDMGVFGGILVGMGVAMLHNKFYKIKLPDILSFFSGTRFIPIISSVVFALVGISMYFIWPFVQNLMLSLSSLITKSGYIGTFIFGLIERSLIPFGLHHVFYLPFWQTQIGGSLYVDGKFVHGAQNIFFAQLASPNVTKFSVEASKFFTGKFPFMIFGLPGAALAMFNVAKKNKKKVVGGLLLSATMTSMLTGITEPIEFTFLFVAPILYIIHCLFAGISFMLMHIFNVSVGMTFSAGIIDLLLFGIIQGNSKTNWIMILPVGICYFIMYYFVFKFIIKKMNLITPGREEDEVQSKLFTKNDFNVGTEKNIVSQIVLGLGGVENVLDVGCCISRLRISVKNSEKVSEVILKNTGASGVIKKGTAVQIVYGPKAAVIKSELEEYIKSL